MAIEKYINKKTLSVSAVFALLLCVGVYFSVSGISLFQPKTHGDVVVLGPSDDLIVSKTMLSGPESLEKSAIHVEMQGNTDVPIDIYLEQNDDLGALRATGKGLEEFANVEITHGIHKMSTKADWSGMFRVNFPLHVIEADKPLRFAFSGYDMMSDAQNFKPLEVEVFWAPGGGGPTSDGVNDYDHLFCGDPPLSTCVSSKMNAQIKAVVQNYDRSLLMMGEQLSAVMMQYVQIIGSFLDAKSQMTTQRLQQSLKAEAIKDYHPSDQMCRFGSFVKSVSKVERKKDQTKQALNKLLMSAYTGVEFNSTSESIAGDLRARLKQYSEAYCDPHDNNNGLSAICGSGASDKSRINSDIDYTRTINFPLTLDVNFMNADLTNTEQDVMALATNLYWPQAMNHADKKGVARDPVQYMNLRHFYAMNNLAHNSFSHLVSMKSSAPTDSADSGARYMKAMLRELGLTNAQIDQYLGQYPGYYAQMEVLTKKIYQTPNFYTNLYDKPANVERIGVTLDAIKLMQMRDMHEASLRREMLTSALVETALKGPANKIDDAIQKGVAKRLTKD